MLGEHIQEIAILKINTIDGPTFNLSFFNELEFYLSILWTHHQGYRSEFISYTVVL